METNDLLDDQFQNSADGSMVITAAGEEFLRQSAKWGNFLAIIGFIMAGMMVIAGIFMGIAMGAVGAMSGFEDAGIGFPPMLFSLFYIVLAVLYFFPTLYLYRFAAKTKSAVAKGDSIEMEDAFENLKSMFRFFGIMTIVMIGLYVVGIFVSIAFGAFMGL